MAAKIYRINYKSDFMLTLTSDAGWTTPFCIKFWTGAPAMAYYAGWDGETYTHCAYDPAEPTKLQVQFDDHHLPVGDLKFQIGYHFTVADFPNDTEDEVINLANITVEINGEAHQVMLDFTGETAPEIEFALPAYANEQQRIENEQQRIANEQQRIAAEEQRVTDFGAIEEQAQQAISEAGSAAQAAYEAAGEAANVNAELDGTILTITNRQGVSESVDVEGPVGPVGPQGEPGRPGEASTITVGTTTTGAPGTDAQVVNRGTSSAAVLDFTIPRGEPGEVTEVEMNAALDLKEDKANKVTEIDDNSTDVQYPSAKAVNTALASIEEALYGESQEYDPVKAYFTIQPDNVYGLDFRSVWDNTNIKNEASGSCIIDFGDGSEPVSIVNRDSMIKHDVPAGTYIVSITGITSVLGNTMLRESTLLIDAKLPSTLTSVAGWLFNGVPNMSEVTFMGTTPPVFSGSGTSASSLNLVSVIKVPESALSAYQSSTMSDAMKAKLEAFSTGIVGDITDIKTDVANLHTDIDETNESVQELADYVDSKIPALVDKTKTYFTIEVPAGNINLKTIYNTTNIKNETAGTCTIDYGDGTPVVAISSADDLVHNYAQAGTYTLTVTGLTGLTSNLLFREMSILKDAKFGNTFVNPSTYYMLNGVTMESVTFFAETPLTWNFGIGYGASNMNLVSKIIVPKDSLLSYLNAWYFDASTINKDWLTKKIIPDEPVDYYYKSITVTVGQSGDFTSLNDAIQSLSRSYPIYQPGGLKAVIKILSGTTIAEQVYVDGLDLSWITIEYEDYNPEALNYDSVAEGIANGTIVFDTTEGYNSVSVDATNFSNTSHDLRGDFALFRAENGARLPIIGCVFKLTTPHASTGIAGAVCNRGSEAVVKTLCGFIGFQDGVISNNESSITIREGITMNCSRWGCHARHNGEVSARSVIATGCATDTTKASEYGAAVADRVADMDVREAYLGGNYAIRCHNASSICARSAHVVGGGVENAYLVQATYSGKINASQMTFANIVEGSKMFEVLYAGWIDAFGVTDKTYNVASLNAISGDNGIVWG